MNPGFLFTMNVTVHDAAELYRHARESCLRNGMTEDQIEEYLKTEGEPDIAVCIQEILDPGMSPPGIQIENSHCEQLWDTA